MVEKGVLGFSAAGGYAVAIPSMTGWLGKLVEALRR